MATFKAVIRKTRKDGYCPVYIRVVHNQKPGYIMTDKVIRLSLSSQAAPMSRSKNRAAARRQQL